MAQALAIALKIENGQVVTAQLRQIGATGSQALQSLGSSAQQASVGMHNLRLGGDAVGKSISAVKSAVAGYLSLQMAQEVTHMADAWQQAGSRIAIGTGSMEAAKEVQMDLFKVAQDSRMPLEDVLQAYTLMSIPLKELGYNGKQAVDVVRALANAVLASGVSGVQASAGFLQFSQAVGRVLGGDELKSLYENTFRVVKAIADAIGVSTSELQQMGSDWQLSGRVITKAVEDQSEVLAGEAARVVRTFGQAQVQLRNEVMKTAGELYNQTGATTALVGAIDDLRYAITSPDFASGGTAMLTRFVETLADISAGIAESKRQVEEGKRLFDELTGEGQAKISGWHEELASEPSAAEGPLRALRQAFTDVFDHAQGGATTAGQAFRSIGNAVVETSPPLKSLLDLIIENSPTAAGTIDSIATSIFGVSSEAKAAAAELSAFYQGAITPPNFAGASNFRSAQEVGMDVATTVEKKKGNVKPDPKRDPSGKSDEERALDEARRNFIQNEKVITDLIQEISKATDERDQFVRESVQKLNAWATDEQIAQTKELAGATWDAARAMEAAAGKRAGQVEMEKQALALNQQNAPPAVQFAKKMQALDALRGYGLDENAYRVEARKLSDDAAAAVEEANKRTLDSYEETYAQVGRIVDQAYQGISAGLAAMIVQGEADFETFVDGMAQSMLQSGLQTLMMSLIGGGTQGGGILGMLMGGGGGAPILGMGGSGLTGGTSTFRSAHGNVFSGGNIVPFARGGIVDRPVVFPMAKGAGLMGEAGPEAVMPLRRLPSGDLGVMSGGSGAPPQITITLVNESRTQLRAEQQTGPDGGLKVMLREIIGAEIGTPGTPGHMATRGVVQRYGNGR